MSALPLYAQMFRYQAWANADMLRALGELEPALHQDQRHLGIRLMNHCLVINQIFQAHLQRQPSPHSAVNTKDTPALDALRAAHATLDQWYLDYLPSLSAEALAERLPFRFTDGEAGYMSRNEMLAHVVTHNTYHRGEVGMLLKQASAVPGTTLTMPWDTYAVFLHQDEPARRQQGQPG
ncbi:DinB family protein [Leeia sp.]|uniref:DinB family protein n=1 Tax=Leeia sp. TaxID=2884678 RepID=UPI0035B08FA6